MTEKERIANQIDKYKKSNEEHEKRIKELQKIKAKNLKEIDKLESRLKILNYELLEDILKNQNNMSVEDLIQKFNKKEPNKNDNINRFSNNQQYNQYDSQSKVGV